MRINSPATLNRSKTLFAYGPICPGEVDIDPAPRIDPEFEEGWACMGSSGEHDENRELPRCKVVLRDVRPRRFKRVPPRVSPDKSVRSS